MPMSFQAHELWSREEHKGSSSMPMTEPSARIRQPRKSVAPVVAIAHATVVVQLK